MTRTWLVSAQADAEGADAARALALQLDNDPKGDAYLLGSYGSTLDLAGKPGSWSM